MSTYANGPVPKSCGICHKTKVLVRYNVVAAGVRMHEVHLCLVCDGYASRRPLQIQRGTE